jgi:uncharacterized protein YaaN involved in tellurite resistance
MAEGSEKTTNATEVKEAPVLTFGDGIETKESPAVQMPDASQLKNEKPLDDSMLSDAERKQVDDFAQKIDLSNSQAILQYGVGTQKKMSDFSEKAVENVKTKDMGEVGDLIAGLSTELKNFDVNPDDKGFMSFFKKQGNKINAIKAKYNKVNANVTTITQELNKQQIQLLKDVDVLDHMYDLNLSYFKELTMYILAGKKKLEEVRSTKLVELQNKAAASGLPEDAQAARDLSAQCDRFEKKLYDLELTRTISMQTAPQIRMVQSSDSMMAEKIQSTIVNTIPLWKNQMVIAMGIEHTAEAEKAQREVTDMTNEMLKKNADMLHTATVDAAKESERGIVDIETLKHTNETLISSLDEVMQIQKDGRQKRAEAEVQLADMENQLKTKMLAMSRN